MIATRAPWVLMLWLGLGALFIAVGVDTPVRPALAVSGILWSLIASVVMYRQRGGRWPALIGGGCIMVAVMLLVMSWWPR